MHTRNYLVDVKENERNQLRTNGSVIYLFFFHYICVRCMRILFRMDEQRTDPVNLIIGPILCLPN